MDNNQIDSSNNISTESIKKSPNYSKYYCIVALIIVLIILVLSLFIIIPFINTRVEAGRNEAFLREELQKIAKSGDEHDYTQTAKYYEEIINQVPSFTPAYLGLALLYNSSKFEKYNPTKAKEYCQKAVKIDRTVRFSKSYNICRDINKD